MRKLTLVAAACMLAAGSVASAQQDPIKAAADALGVGGIKTLRITAAGAVFQVGQNFTPDEAWPPVMVKSYTALVNYDTASMRQEFLREMGTVMPRGGGGAFTGEQRQIQVVSGNYAWNVVPAPPAPAPAAGAPAAAPAAPANQPAAANQMERMLTLWSTPHGFLKAAMANKATTRKTDAGTEVSFTIDGKYKMIGLINGRNQVERVQTWIDHPIVGDMLVETEYSRYYDFGTVVFPARIQQKQDGFPSVDLTVASVTLNPAVDITVPDNVRDARPAAVNVVSRKLADGVFWLTGGTHHSLAVEMSDHIVVVDTPNNEARALAVLAKAKELIPNKPILFVVTSHHHWDHLGGIRTAIDEGATIVTHESNRAFLERVVGTPHTLGPDRLAASKKPLKIQTVGATGRLTDGVRTIELHQMTGYLHTNDMLLTYLPKEKVLALADAFSSPATPTTPVVASAMPFAAALADNVQRLKLDVQVIAPFHGGRTADMAEVLRNTGRAAVAGANSN